MTFELPDLTVFFSIFFAVATVGVALTATTMIGFFAQNRAVRVRRREGFVHYYGNLVLGH